MAARRTLTWADVPTMDPPPLGARETPALVAICSILDRLGANERPRIMDYLDRRYGIVDAEIVEDRP